MTTNTLNLKDSDGDLLTATETDGKLYLKTELRYDGDWTWAHVELSTKEVDKFFEFLAENFPERLAAALKTPAAILEGANRTLTFERVGEAGAFTLHHMDAGTSVVYAADGSVTITQK